MTDKTCGTCRWLAPDKQRPGEGACMEGADVRCGTLRGYMACGCLDKACGSYEERADSVEQAAMDMMGYLGFCAEQFIVPFGGKIDEFANRLHELSGGGQAACFRKVHGADAASNH